MIKCLAHQLLKEPNNQVKEVIAAAIGGIGLPEALPCIDCLLKSKEPPSKQVTQLTRRLSECLCGPSAS